MILRNLGILSCGKMLGAVGAGIGLALGAFFSILAAAEAILHNVVARLAPAELTMMFTAALFLPVVYGVMGFAVGIVGAFSFNLASRRFGGIELDLAPPAR
jgi:hypothetical protein